MPKSTIEDEARALTEKYRTRKSGTCQTGTSPHLKLMAAMLKLGAGYSSVSKAMKNEYGVTLGGQNISRHFRGACACEQKP